MKEVYVGNEQDLGVTIYRLLKDKNYIHSVILIDNIVRVVYSKIEGCDN